MKNPWLYGLVSGHLGLEKPLPETKPTSMTDPWEWYIPFKGKGSYQIVPKGSPPKYQRVWMVYIYLT